MENSEKPTSSRKKNNKQPVIQIPDRVADQQVN